MCFFLYFFFFLSLPALSLWWDSFYILGHICLWSSAISYTDFILHMCVCMCVWVSEGERNVHLCACLYEQAPAQVCRLHKISCFCLVIVFLPISLFINLWYHSPVELAFVSKIKVECAVNSILVNCKWLSGLYRAGKRGHGVGRPPRR